MKDVNKAMIEAAIESMRSGELGIGDGLRDMLKGGAGFLKSHLEKAPGDEYWIVASTGAIDRDNEIIVPSAWEKSLPEYLKTNPVILYGHRWGEPPIGKAVDGEVRKNQLRLKIAFAETDFGREIKYLYDEDFMRSFSVGFIPKAGVIPQEYSGNDPLPAGVSDAYWIYTETELLETSAVSIPSNQEAVMQRALKSYFGDGSVLAKRIGVRGTDRWVTNKLEPVEYGLGFTVSEETIRGTLERSGLSEKSIREALAGFGLSRDDGGNRETEPEVEVGREPTAAEKVKSFARIVEERTK